MSELPDTTRRCAHVLLSTWAAMQSEAIWGSAVRLGCHHLQKAGVVTATLEGEEVTVDLGHVVSAAVLTTEWFTRALADAWQVTPDEVLVRLRRFLDEA